MKKLLLSFCLVLVWSFGAAVLKIVSRSEWQAQEPLESDNLKTPVNKVIISYTASRSCSNRSSCDNILRIIQKMQMEQLSFNDIGYNFLIGNDGNVYEGRGWSKVGAHTRSYNIDSIGIAFIGTFQSEVPSEDALNISKELIEEGVRKGILSADYKLYGHRQLAATISPGDSLYAVIKKWPHWGSN